MGACWEGWKRQPLQLADPAAVRLPACAFHALQTAFQLASLELEMQAHDYEHALGMQVSLGGLVHSLTPLAAASPFIHVFDRPCLFRGALWLPYRRDQAELEAAVAAGTAAAAAAAGSGSGAGAGAGLKAIFAHVDVVRFL